MTGEERSEAFAVELMYREAQDHLADAALLSSTPHSHSDSSYLLELLGFELLLKAAVRMGGSRPSKTHKYREEFSKLPPDVKAELMDTAAERMSKAADYSRLDHLLTLWSKNFIDLRYPYDKYDGMSEESYQALGDEWVSRGAMDSEATFVYYWSELHGLVYALQQQVGEWLDGQWSSQQN